MAKPDLVIVDDLILRRLERELTAEEKRALEYWYTRVKELQQEAVS